jgi:hypothetical protein
METASARGVNPARPFAIQPPLTASTGHDHIFAPGESFVFGISLFGDAADLFPYVCQAVHRIGKIGVGYGRGQFVIRDIQAVNPLTGQKMSLIKEHSGTSGHRISGPGLPVTTASIEQAIQAHTTGNLFMRFLTPTQLTHQKQTLSRPDFVSLIARLLERCQSLEQHYTSNPTHHLIWRDRHLKLTEAALQVKLIENRTHWVNVYSGSRRSNRRNSIGGFIGEVGFEGDMTVFLPWLFWGQSLHVGKNAVKGNGWYEILRL